MDFVKRLFQWTKRVTGSIASYLKTPVEEWTLSGARQKWLNVPKGEAVIGPDTSVTGSLKADNIVVKGRVNGRVTASQLTINRMGVLEGRVFAESFAVDEHATLDARCRVRQGSRETPAPKEKGRTQNR